ncbi:MAG: hypothetical protein P0Y53_09735 [Candidatus Pseudobacter hemicellulosilyticus]|uniref:Gliding motility-associated protein GldM N-terminal domain-containing protein n=1 Tax=Candidatus Pseudobacter hemicellulosilyticus TaxID=3121375 RepID=A0AAJ5WWA8_9BACT|nr:MAG: hypothetical protein P0Y53_09735 [Pseudobacter sp.]
MKKFIPILSACWLFAYCQSPADAIKEAFNKVNQSLDSSNEIIVAAYEQHYASIRKNRQRDTSLAMKADSIYSTTVTTSNYLDSLMQEIKTKDSSGTKSNIAGKMLIGTNAEKRLSSLLLQHDKHISEYITDSSQLRSEGNLITNEVKTNPGWAKDLFEMTPTMSAITILHSLQMEVINNCKFVLLKIQLQMTGSTPAIKQ